MPDKNPNNFQSSSFIPKNKEPKKRSRRVDAEESVGVLTQVAVGILALALLLAGASLFYAQYLKNDLADKKQQITDAQAAFDTSVIRELENFDTRLTAVNDIIEDHTAVTPIFGLIEANTVASVQLSSVSIGTDPIPLPTPEGPAGNNVNTAEGVGATSTANAAPPPTPTRMVPITLSGITDTYAAVVLQAQALSDSEIIQEPELSSFALNEQGRVTFSTSFSVPLEYVGYDQIYRTAAAPAQQTQSPPAGTQEASVNETPAANEGAAATNSPQS